MNTEEDDIFSDDFATPDDKNDQDYCPPESSVETDMSSGEDSQKTKVQFERTLSPHNPTKCVT